MPHTSSAKKSLRQDAKRRERNRTVKKGLKVQLKKYLKAAEGGDAGALQEELKVSAKLLDKAASKGVIHRNKAARKKSQLARLANTKKAAPPAGTPS